MAVANLRFTVKNLKKKGDDGMTGFEQQMKVYLKHCFGIVAILTSLMQIIKEMSSHHPVTFTDAEQEYNSSKNRFPDKLPSECYNYPMPN